MSDKTLQQRLRDREGDNDDDLIDAAADALDAQAERIKALEGALRGFSCECGPFRCMAHGDDTDKDDCKRHQARALLGEK